MKRLYVILIAALLLSQGGVWAQCIINNANNVNGITPSTMSDTIVQGIVYSQTLQIHLPTSYDGFTVDSVHISSISGAPAGINYIINPASGTINGGANGVVCFAGTTYADTGSYPLIFNGLAYLTFFGQHTSASLSSIAYFSYAFRVVAQPPSGSPPVAGFLSDSFGCLNVPVTFTDQSIDSPTIWQWTFSGGNPPSSVDSTASVTYTDTGYYTVKLVVGNNFGYDSITKTIHITGQPGGMVLVNPVTGGPDSANGSVIVSATGGTAPYAYTWSVNNSGTDSLNDVGTGTYYITITDNNGCLAFDTAIVTLAPPVSAFSYDSPACLTSIINFTDQSSNSPTSWQWLFINAQGIVANGPNGSASFADTGNYTVVLIASNAGGSDTLAKTIDIIGKFSAIADITPATEAAGDTNGSVILTVTGGTAPYSFAWNGNFSNSDTLNNLAGGTYYITIADYYGCQSPDTVVVPLLQPVVDFSGDTLVCVNTPVTFTDQSSDNPIGWSWTFTGGNPPTADTSFASVTYADTGYYPVQLILTYSFGYDSITKMIHVVGYPGVTDTTVQLTCGDSIWFGGVAYKTTVTQTDTFTGVYGCDSLVTLHLFVTQNINLYDTIACGNSLNFYGSLLDTTGVYSAFRNGNNECDSLLTLNLTVNSAQVSFTWDSLIAAQDIRHYPPYLNSSDTVIWCVMGGPRSFVLTGASPVGGVYTGAGISNDTLYAYQLLFDSNYVTLLDTITYTYQCASVSGILILDVCDGINQINNATLLQLYPNPANDYLTVNYTGFSDNSKIEIADITGRIVMTNTVAPGVSKTDIDTRTLNNGLYFISVENGGVMKASSKFIVIR